jgi:hypothetical protein
MRKLDISFCFKYDEVSSNAVTLGHKTRTIQDESNLVNSRAAMGQTGTRTGMI